MINLARGGKRIGSGRKTKGGLTKSVRICLPQEAWESLQLDAIKEGTQSDALRRIIMEHYRLDDHKR